MLKALKTKSQQIYASERLFLNKSVFFIHSEKEYEQTSTESENHCLRLSYSTEIDQSVMMHHSPLQDLY